MSIRKWKDLGSDALAIKKALEPFGLEYDLELGAGKPNVLVLRKGGHEVRLGQSYGLDCCIRDNLTVQKWVLKGKLGNGQGAISIKECFETIEEASERKGALERAHGECELEYNHETVVVQT